MLLDLDPYLLQLLLELPQLLLLLLVGLYANRKKRHFVTFHLPQAVILCATLVGLDGFAFALVEVCLRVYHTVVGRVRTLTNHYLALFTCSFMLVL